MLDGTALPKPTDGARKDDAGKPMMGYMMSALWFPLMLVAKVLTFGAQKYAKGGWKDVPDAAERYNDALHRHLNAHYSGEVNDPESGLPHLAHAATNVLFLLYFQKFPQESK